MSEEMEDFMTIEEVSKKMKVSVMTIYRMIKRKELPAFKFGRNWRISSKKLLELYG